MGPRAGLQDMHRIPAPTGYRNPVEPSTLAFICINRKNVCVLLAKIRSI